MITIAHAQVNVQNELGQQHLNMMAAEVNRQQILEMERTATNLSEKHTLNQAAAFLENLKKLRK